MSYVDFLSQHWPDYLAGLWVSIRLSVLALLIGLPAGAGLALLGLHSQRVVRYITIAVVEVGRGIPSIIVLYLAYFGLPTAGIVLEAFAAAVVGLAFTTAAYSSEVIRAGIREVPNGQFEASSALALSWWRQMRLIILPQAISKVVPPLIALCIGIFQATALAYAITVPELLSRAYQRATVTYEWTPALMTAGLVYAVFTLTLNVLTRTTAGAVRRRGDHRTTPTRHVTEENNAIPV